ARVYLWPRLAELEARTVVLPILLLHAMRHLGLMFLAPGAVYPGMPPQFANPAALGDLFAAILALIAIPAVVTRSRLARPLVGLFNVAGTPHPVDPPPLAQRPNTPPRIGPGHALP